MKRFFSIFFAITLVMASPIGVFAEESNIEKNELISEAVVSEATVSEATVSEDTVSETTVSEDTTSALDGEELLSELTEDEDGEIQEIPYLKTEKKDDGKLLVHFLNVGKADSILLQVKDSAILIDAGKVSSGPDIASYLKTVGIEKLDAFIVTHPHDDHFGGCEAITDFFQIDKCYTSNPEKLPRKVKNWFCSNGYSFEAPNDGDVIFNKNGLKLTVVYDGRDYLHKRDSKSINNQSIILRADFGEKSFLFTGDSLPDAQKKMLNGSYSDLLACDVLKVPHHGSLKCVSDSFLKKVNPSYSVISASNITLSGYHTKKTREQLKKVSTLYTTKEYGTVLCATDGNSITFKTEVTPYGKKLGANSWNSSLISGLDEYYNMGTPVMCFKKLNHTISLSVGDKMRFECDGDSPEWSSSKDSRVEVDDNGVIECVGTGKATVRCKRNISGKWKKKSIKIKVIN